MMQVGDIIWTLEVDFVKLSNLTTLDFIFKPFLKFLEEAEYVNGNFAPCHLQQLYLAQFSHEIPPDDDTSSKCTKG